MAFFNRIDYNSRGEYGSEIPKEDNESDENPDYEEEYSENKSEIPDEADESDEQHDYEEEDAETGSEIPEEDEKFDVKQENKEISSENESEIPEENETADDQQEYEEEDAETGPEIPEEDKKSDIKQENEENDTEIESEIDEDNETNEIKLEPNENLTEIIQNDEKNDTKETTETTPTSALLKSYILLDPSEGAEDTDRDGLETMVDQIQSLPTPPQTLPATDTSSFLGETHQATHNPTAEKEINPLSDAHSPPPESRRSSIPPLDQPKISNHSDLQKQSKAPLSHTSEVRIQLQEIGSLECEKLCPLLDLPPANPSPDYVMHQADVIALRLEKLRPDLHDLPPAESHEPIQMNRELALAQIHSEIRATQDVLLHVLFEEGLISNASLQKARELGNNVEAVQEFINTQIWLHEAHEGLNCLVKTKLISQIEDLGTKIRNIFHPSSRAEFVPAPSLLDQQIKSRDIPPISPDLPKIPNSFDRPERPDSPDHSSTSPPTTPLLETITASASVSQTIAAIKKSLPLEVRPSSFEPSPKSTASLTETIPVTEPTVRNPSSIPPISSSCIPIKSETPSPSSDLLLAVIPLSRKKHHEASSVLPLFDEMADLGFITSTVRPPLLSVFPSDRYTDLPPLRDQIYAPSLVSPIIPSILPAYSIESFPSSDLSSSAVASTCEIPRSTSTSTSTSISKSTSKSKSSSTSRMGTAKGTGTKSRTNMGTETKTETSTTSRAGSRLRSRSPDLDSANFNQGIVRCFLATQHPSFVHSRQRYVQAQLDHHYSYFQYNHIVAHSYAILVDDESHRMITTTTAETLLAQPIPLRINVDAEATESTLPPAVRSIISRGFTRGDLFTFTLFPYLFPRIDPSAFDNRYNHQHLYTRMQTIREFLEIFKPAADYLPPLLELEFDQELGLRDAHMGLFLKFAPTDFDPYTDRDDFKTRNAQYRYLTSVADFLSTVGVGLMKCSVATRDLLTIFQLCTDSNIEKWTKTTALFSYKYKRILDALNLLYRIFPWLATQLVRLFPAEFLVSSRTADVHWQVLTVAELTTLLTQLKHHPAYRRFSTQKDILKTFFRCLTPHSTENIDVIQPSMNILTTLARLTAYSIYLPHRIAGKNTKILGVNKWSYLDLLLTGFLHALSPIASALGVVTQVNLHEMINMESTLGILKKSLPLHEALLMDLLVADFLSLFPGDSARDRLDAANLFVQSHIEHPGKIWSTESEPGRPGAPRTYSPVSLLTHLPALQIFSGFRSATAAHGALQWLNQIATTTVTFNFLREITRPLQGLSVPEIGHISRNFSRHLTGFSGICMDETWRWYFDYHKPIRFDFTPTNPVHWLSLARFSIAHKWIDGKWHARILDFLYWTQASPKGHVFGGLWEVIGAREWMYGQPYAAKKIDAALTWEGIVEERTVCRYPATYIAEFRSFIPWYRQKCQEMQVYSLGYRMPFLTDDQATVMEQLRRSNPNMNDFEILTQLHTSAVNKYTYDENGNRIEIEFDQEITNPANPLHSTWNSMKLTTVVKKDKWNPNDAAIQYFMSLFGLEIGHPKTPHEPGFNYILRNNIDMRQHWDLYWYSGPAFLYDWFRSTVPGKDHSVSKDFYDEECPDFYALAGAFPEKPQPVNKKDRENSLKTILFSTNVQMKKHALSRDLNNLEMND